MNELKPCPFCGLSRAAKALTEQEIKGLEGNTPSYAVVCDFNHGGCGAVGGYRTTLTKAIEAWNRRAEDAINAPRHTERERLIKAAALIMAEIDRVDRHEQ